METLTSSPALHVGNINSGDTSLLKAVDSYRNENVLYRFQSKLNLKANSADQLFLDTKRFLFICARFPDKGPFSPAPPIDDGWHEFLMFTQDYQDFCSRFFGKFLHHYPFVPGIPVKPGGVYRSYNIARRIFGEDLSTNWMLPNTGYESMDAMSNCSCSGSCGGGCNG